MAASTYRNTWEGISACIGNTKAMCPSAPTHQCLASANGTVPSEARSEQNRNCTFYMNPSRGSICQNVSQTHQVLQDR